MPRDQLAQQVILAEPRSCEDSTLSEDTVLLAAVLPIKESIKLGTGESQRLAW